METIQFRPSGVCSTNMEIDVENGTIADIRVEGGCHGNLQGIAALARGMSTQEMIDRLKGIRCQRKSTSCPDQLARGLEKALES